MDAVLEFADRCADDAEKAGAQELSRCLRRVPRKSPTNLLEACVFMKFMIFTLRCNRSCHMTLGRFDKYMRPFYQKDLAAGKTRANHSYIHFVSSALAFRVVFFAVGFFSMVFLALLFLVVDFSCVFASPSSAFFLG